MPKHNYALERGGEKSLEISWKGRFINFEVRFEGNLLGTIPNKKELQKGQIFQLPDGTSLLVQMIQSELRVLRDGQPLPGSISDPAARLKLSFQFIFFIAALNIVLGLATLFFQVKYLQALGYGIISIALGLIFLVLGFFTQRRSRTALIIALIIFGLDCALAIFSIAPFLLSFTSMVFSLFEGSVQPVFGVKAGEGYQPNAVFLGVWTFFFVLRIYFLRSMWLGIGAINTLKKEIPPSAS